MSNVDSRLWPAELRPASPQPGHLPLVIYRGDTYAWQFKVWIDEAKTQPLNLDSVTAMAQIRDRPDGRNFVVMPAVVTLPNIIDMTLSAADSAKAPTGGWDLQLTLPDQSVLTILAGRMLVIGDYSEIVV